MQDLTSWRTHNLTDLPSGEGQILGRSHTICEIISLVAQYLFPVFVLITPISPSMLVHSSSHVIVQSAVLRSVESLFTRLNDVVYSLISRCWDLGLEIEVDELFRVEPHQRLSFPIMRHHIPRLSLASSPHSYPDKRPFRRIRHRVPRRWYA